MSSSEMNVVVPSVIARSMRLRGGDRTGQADVRQLEASTLSYCSAWAPDSVATETPSSGSGAVAAAGFNVTDGLLAIWVSVSPPSLPLNSATVPLTFTCAPTTTSAGNSAAPEPRKT